jgi:hypothetical protein
MWVVLTHGRISVTRRTVASHNIKFDRNVTKNLEKEETDEVDREIWLGG